MSQEEFGEEYKRTNTILYCIRTIQWVISMLEKTGLDKDTIDLYLAGVQELVHAAEKQPQYLEVKRYNEAAIDIAEYYSRIGLSGGRILLTSTVFAQTMRIYGLAITELEKSGLPFRKDELYQATERLKAARNIELVKANRMKRLGEAIDALNLSDGLEKTW